MPPKADIRTAVEKGLLMTLSGHRACTGKVKGTVRDTGGTKLGSIGVTTDPPSNSGTTNKGGKYSIGEVPTDTVSMVAACPSGEQFEPVTVIADATVTVDFNACD